MIKPGDNVVIVGDSWACGEWAAISKTAPPDKYNMLFPNYRMIHSGLTLFLQNFGCSVNNLGIPGGSNIESLDALTNYLSEKRPDIIYWFQTDPARDFDIDTWKSFNSLSEFSEQKLIRLAHAYKEFNSLGVPIQCIGGLYKLNTDLMTPYTNLKPFIVSVIEMFEGTQPEHINPASLVELELLSYEFIEELSTIPHMRTLLPKQWFYPDGGHPNRYAHKKIFEYILNYK